LVFHERSLIGDFLKWRNYLQESDAVSFEMCVEF
jgi:hypothetical protein